MKNTLTSHQTVSDPRATTIASGLWDRGSQSLIAAASLVPEVQGQSTIEKLASVYFLAILDLTDFAAKTGLLPDDETVKGMDISDKEWRCIQEAMRQWEMKLIPQEIVSTIFRLGTEDAVAELRTLPDIDSPEAKMVLLSVYEEVRTWLRHAGVRVELLRRRQS